MRVLDSQSNCELVENTNELSPVNPLGLVRWLLTEKLRILTICPTGKRVVPKRTMDTHRAHHHLTRRTFEITPSLCRWATLFHGCLCSEFVSAAISFRSFELLFSIINDDAGQGTTGH